MMKLVLSAGLVLSALPAFAHGGHAAARETGVLHWLTETDHAMAIGLTLAVAGVVAWALHRSRQG